jgi:small-conductance mechanosensitive channel
MVASVLIPVVTAIERAFAWEPAWMIGLGVLLGSACVAMLAYNLVLRLLGRISGHFGAMPHMLIEAGRRPVALILLISTIGAALPAAGLPTRPTTLIAQTMVVLAVLAIGWGASNTMQVAATIYLSRFRIDVDDNLLARKHVTQVRILLRAGQTLIVMVTIAIALMTIPAVRQFGVSLFASAGAAGIVLGLAARPVLGNLLAGIQIAITQPIRVEDAVVVEGEWGWIEAITSTYVVVRIWDLRRMILPLTYFIEKPFQNWTRESADLLGSVLLNVDFTVPVDAVRVALNDIVHASKLWDGKVAVLQVSDIVGNMVQLRALVSAINSGKAWDLRCEVREKLIAFLQRNYPDALPRQRIDISSEAQAAVKRHAA